VASLGCVPSPSGTSLVIYGANGPPTFRSPRPEGNRPPCARSLLPFADGAIAGAYVVLRAEAVLRNPIDSLALLM
jgi:hypothetical protein